MLALEVHHETLDRRLGGRDQVDRLHVGEGLAPLVDRLHDWKEIGMELRGTLRFGEFASIKRQKKKNAGSEEGYLSTNVFRWIETF